MKKKENLKSGLYVQPAAAGAVVGIYFLKRIPQKAFKIVMQILAAAAAVKLLF